MARRVASRVKFKGIQEASRKRRPPSLNAGVWAGCIASTNRVISKTITRENKTKLKGI